MRPGDQIVHGDQEGKSSDIARLDALTRKITSSRTFAELIESTPKTGYVPTLRPWPGKGKAARQNVRDVAVLADAYDLAMASRGRPERAWRGSNAPRVDPYSPGALKCEGCGAWYPAGEFLATRRGPRCPACNRERR